MWTFDFTDEAKDHVAFFKKSGDKVVLKKINGLIKEICITPFSGTGKPEPLKHNLSGLWSRRINREHRIVYEVLDKIIVIHSLKGHYE